MGMKVKDAENLLGLTDECYDESSVAIAAIRAAKQHRSLSDARDILNAKETLIRNVRSDKKTNGNSMTRQMASAATNASLLRHDGTKQGNGSGKTDGSQTKGNATGTGHDMVTYKELKDEASPSALPHGDTSKVLKAILVTIWRLFPWRAVVSIVSLLLSIVLGYTVSGVLPRAISGALALILAVAFWCGIVDVFKGYAWPGIMKWTGHKIDEM